MSVYETAPKKRPSFHRAASGAALGGCLALLASCSGVDGSGDEALDDTPPAGGEAANQPELEPAPTSEVDSAPSVAAESPGAPSAEIPAVEAPEVEARQRCSAPSGAANPPRSVLEVIDLVNALPRPLTLPCFLETLPRPIEAYATRGIISAQPAAGTRSPRMFLFFDPLIMSIVPDGNGRNLLELGEQVAPSRSLKAEIEFPLDAELPREAPFERLQFIPELSSCGVCHADEVLSPDIDFTEAWVSDALRPAPFERVEIVSVAEEARLCDPELEAERCAMLDALFGGGDVVERAFPEEMPTFY